jgi:hypothetical protein
MNEPVSVSHYEDLSIRSIEEVLEAGLAWREIVDNRVGVDISDLEFSIFTD